eukprot:9193273-Pyramimonas_sp.AAC.1
MVRRLDGSPPSATTFKCGKHSGPPTRRDHRAGVANTWDASDWRRAAARSCVSIARGATQRVAPTEKVLMMSPNEGSHVEAAARSTRECCSTRCTRFFSRM